MQDPLAPLRVVITADSCRDPALAMSYAELAEYRRTRNPDLVKCKPGMSPRWFDVQRLPRPRAVALRTITAESYRRVAFVKSAVHSFTQPDGKLVTAPGMTDLGPDGKVAPDEWWQEIADVAHQDAVDELGDVAEDFAKLPKGATGPFGFRLG